VSMTMFATASPIITMLTARPPPHAGAAR